ncbi:hypothetical protein EJ02DRAFT_501307 [Clathrospora elynae]|uniref:Zn(2)-C6 fungal-type domain-containing protein n=1 Tax=Clathrospora elynae TaxID=706981 RepID=A0A6A5SXJ8_9PLEO|nr:hypothetical protein EJ02DRAFT_501307 [Clathrospora elynae]
MTFDPQTSQWQYSPLTVNGPTSTPIMSPPTSAPKSSASGKEKRLKLRASCDSCASSKVKCSKEHPICARCSANGSPCIYGVSRKHGKPGRTRKRNPDGTPFIKASKQRPSPDGSEFSRFRIQPEPVLQLPEMDTASWSSSWSPTPSLPDTSEFEFEMTPEPFYMNMDSSDLTFMSDMLLPMAQLEPEPEPTQTTEPEFSFRDPFAKRQSVQLNLPDLQALKDYTGGDVVNPMEYTFSDTTTMDSFQPFSSSTPQSPKSQPINSYNPMRVSISMPTSHSCYTLAYSTLESLRVIGADTTQAYPSLEQKSLDSVLSITKLAVQSVLQLLSCPCSSDPHLAMLYSSITSKILTWYQIAAGVNPTASSSASVSPALSSLSGSSGFSSPSSSGFSSPMITPSAEEELTFNAQVQPLRFGLYEFNKLEQERLRRQLVLGELTKCGQLVEALANWGGEGLAAEQAEFLYDVLGAWLKSQLYKTVREVEAVDAL